MLRVRRLTLVVPAAAALCLAACGGFGKVEQGLVVAADGEVLTLILDSNPTGEPRYDRLPPVKVRIPDDPGQMGPAPEAGRLLELDTAAGRLAVYDPDGERILAIGFELLERTGNVYPDDPRVRDAGLPRVDAENRTVTLYWPRTRELVTIRVEPKYLELPRDAWRAGDEVRYYFKDPGQALRVMNVSKTHLR